MTCLSKWYIISCRWIWKLWKQVYWNIWTRSFFVCTRISMASLFKEDMEKIRMMMMMVMMSCFCGMVDRRKAFSLISSRDHCQRSSPSQISDTPRAGFEPSQNLSLGLVECSCAVVITAIPRRQYWYVTDSWKKN